MFTVKSHQFATNAEIQRQIDSFTVVNYRAIKVFFTLSEDFKLVSNISHVVISAFVFHVSRNERQYFCGYSDGTNYYVTKITTTCSPVIGQSFDTMIVA